MMESDRQILKCLPAYLEIRELFHIATTTLVLLSERPNNFSCIDELVYRLKRNQLKPNLKRRNVMFIIRFSKIIQVLQR